MVGEGRGEARDKVGGTVFGAAETRKENECVEGIKNRANSRIFIFCRPKASVPRLNVSVSAYIQRESLLISFVASSAANLRVVPLVNK